MILMHATDSPGPMVCEWPSTRFKEIIVCVSYQLSFTGGLQLAMMGKCIPEKLEILKCYSARRLVTRTGKFSDQGASLSLLY